MAETMGVAVIMLLMSLAIGVFIHLTKEIFDGVKQGFFAMIDSLEEKFNKKK